MMVKRRAEVTVSPDQLSLAIGRGGQNVRMAARLTGWKIDIKATEFNPADNENDEESNADHEDEEVEEHV